jgi:hypothetical protein
VYRANFAEDLVISDTSLLESYLDSLSQPGAALIQQAQSPESKEKLRAQTERAVALGIFEGPTFVVALNCSGEMTGWRRLFPGISRIDKARDLRSNAIALAWQGEFVIE